MKKLVLFFASILLFAAMGCKDDEPVVKKSISGKWKPVKMVETTVSDNVTASETYIYTPCQQESRWIFKNDKKGSVVMKDDTYTECHTKFESNLTYEYNDKTGDIKLNYLTSEDNGKVSDLTESTMNLKIETLNAEVYKSKVYTLVKTK